MKRAFLLLVLFMGFTSSSRPIQAPNETDVLVVGAGISGLSAALEAARGGASVQVVEMWSIFGGHAVMSHGGVSIVGTPVQESQGVTDSPELAERDFLEWGEDANPEWVAFYVRNSRKLIYDWLTEMGVTFSDGVSSGAGNSADRFHNPDGRGLGLVAPIYRACVLNANVHFTWNVKVDGLIREEGRLVGVKGVSMRSRERVERRAKHIILATGGFQSNLQMVREFWPTEYEFPEKMLIGSGVNSVGSGHRVAQEVGAALFYMDHQWNYATGLPDPAYPGMNRGLNARNSASIWVNTQGNRFVNEVSSNKVRFKALLEQKPSRYWAIIDEKGKRRMWVSGSDWASFETIEKVLLENRELTKKEDSIEALASAIAIPTEALTKTLDRYNRMVEEGVDRDFDRFDQTTSEDSRPARIDTPPFYAMPFFPMTRKSMGGVSIDRETHVLTGDREPIPGLYAVGELAGFGGINGKAGLEGTFLGPCIVTGRVAGRTVLRELAKEKRLTSTTEVEPPAPRRSPETMDSNTCLECHDLVTLIAEPQPGYSHFEKVHGVVGDRSYECSQCHARLFPYDEDRHLTDPVAQIDSCSLCHLAAEH